LAARASKLFLPTLREDPADAEAVSHKLLVRGASSARSVPGCGRTSRSADDPPQGRADHPRGDERHRREEFLAPLLTPVELWEATGRDKIPEIFHVTDRSGRRFVLPLPEDVHVPRREIRSYKELPQLWYHFSVKDRTSPAARRAPGCASSS
jgi:prolyl-tRNA synthetase